MIKIIQGLQEENKLPVLGQLLFSKSVSQSAVMQSPPTATPGSALEGRNGFMLRLRLRLTVVTVVTGN